MKKVCWLLVRLVFSGLVSSSFYLIGAEIPQSFNLKEEDTGELSWLQSLIEEQEAELKYIYESYGNLTESDINDCDSEEREKIIERMRLLGKSYSSSLFSAILYGDLESVEGVLGIFGSLEEVSSSITGELLFTGIELLDYAANSHANKAIEIRKQACPSQQEIRCLESQRAIIYLLLDRLQEEKIAFKLPLNILEKAIKSGSLTLVKFFMVESGLFSLDKADLLKLFEYAIRVMLSPLMLERSFIEEGRIDIIKFIAEQLIELTGLSKEELLQNSTVLHEAIRARADDIASLILEYGAQLLGLRVESHTPFELAGRVGWHKLRSFSSASNIYLNPDGSLGEFPLRDYEQPANTHSANLTEVCTSSSSGQRKKKTVRWADESQTDKAFIEVFTFRRRSSATETNVPQAQENQESTGDLIAPEAPEEGPDVVDTELEFNEVDKVCSNSTSQEDAANVSLSTPLETSLLHLAIGNFGVS